MDSRSFVRVRGARQHNLKNIDVDVPRDALVVFSGISGSGKSSLAFGTIFAEAQRRYLESVAPYARRLIDQAGVPEVDSIEGLPPAIALQQQRGTPSTRSTVGTVTTLSSSLRLLYSRAGTYPVGQPMLAAEKFSANTPQGACPTCHGQGHVYEVTEGSMVPDDSLTIRQRAIAAWPLAWGGQNLRDILVSMGIDVDVPWRELPKKTRDWILFTEETPTVPVYAGLTPAQTRDARRRKLEPSYQGTFTGAKRYVLQTFANTQSALMKRRVARSMIGSSCATCEGKRLKPEALAVKFAGLDLGELSRLPLSALHRALSRGLTGKRPPEERVAAQRLVEEVLARVTTLTALGLGYLSLERSTPTCSPGELQRLRLATQIRSNLFGVIYVLDEPSAGLHPADGAPLLEAFDALTRSGNSVYVVEHDLDVMRHAQWIVDVGPDAGSQGGEVLYSGPPEGLRHVRGSHTARHLFEVSSGVQREVREPRGWLTLTGVTRNNLRALDAAFPLGCLCAVTGVSGSGKSSLVSQALLDLVSRHLGHEPEEEGDEEDDPGDFGFTSGTLTGGAEHLSRLVRVDQKPIGRTPRSNLATYTGLFDHVRKRFAATKDAKRRGFDAGRFSFNVKAGRCPRCEGEGFVSVELIFMPSVYAPCPVCHGTRYDERTLEVKFEGKSIAQVLALTVDEACTFFEGDEAVLRSLLVLQDIGLGYLRLGQPATELSGGEAQRIKLATELQRASRGQALYVLDEPTTGLHPSDTEKLLRQLHGLVDQVALQAYYRNVLFFNESTSGSNPDQTGINQSAQNDTMTNILGLNASTRILTDYLIRAGYEFSKTDSLNSRNSNSDVGGDTTSHTGFASASRLFGLYTTAGVSTSYSYQTQDNTKIFNASVFGAYGVPTGLSLSASVGYSILNSDTQSNEGTVSVNALASYRFARALISVGVLQDFQQTAQQGQNFGTVESRSVFGNFLYQLTPFINLVLDARYSEATPTGTGNVQNDRTQTTLTYGAGVNWLVLRWLTASLRYDYTKQTGTNAFNEGPFTSGGSYTENRATLNLFATF